MHYELFFNGSIYLITLYAAWWDYKRCIIPDKVSVLLMLLGLLGALLIPVGDPAFIALSQRLAGATIPAIALLIIYQFDKRIGGGDMKLLTALGFALGLNTLALVLIIATLSATIWSWHKHQKSIPLAVFLAIGITIYFIILNVV